MKADKIKPSIPHNPVPYLTEWLFDIGPSMAAGMGEAAMSFRYIADELATLGVEPLPWELKTLRRLSGDYIDQRAKAKKPDCPAPYSAKRVEIVANRERVSSQISSLFRGLAKRDR